MSQPPSGSEPPRSNVVPYGEVHSTPEVMADISATPSSEKTTYLITDYSGDPVTLDDNLGLRPRARAVSGLRPCAPAPAPSPAPCRASPPSRPTLECQLLPPRAAFGLARTGVAIYDTSPTPSASVPGGASEFGRLYFTTLHTHYTQYTHECQYSSITPSIPQSTHLIY